MAKKKSSSESTSPRVAKKASKQLKSKSSTAAHKSVAGSALTQVKSTAKKAGKKK